MRKKGLLMFLAFAAVLVLALTAAGCGKAEPQAFTETNVNETIKVADDEEFTITLAGNETTGFIWRQDEAATDKKIVEKVSDEYQAPNTGTPGEGGNHVWVFVGKAPGETSITLSYLRPWEPNASPEKTLTFKVKVSE
ncbi:MAG: protease inhibitor I42 family protein [Actinomycetota bacterium]